MIERKIEDPRRIGANNSTKSKHTVKVVQLYLTNINI